MIEVIQSPKEFGPAKAFDWPLANQAELLLRRMMGRFLQKNSFARALSEQMRLETATDFFEWIDHFCVGPEHEPELRAAGFAPEPDCERPTGQTVWAHPHATLPRVLLRSAQPQGTYEVIALRPEFVAEFVACHPVSGPISGEAFSQYRRVVVAEQDGSALQAVERHGYRGFLEKALTSSELQAIIKARELWQTRRRRSKTEGEGFQFASDTLRQVLELVDRNRACQYFFENERHYWQSRNRAARIQKYRQDQLGLGWGNHDHHTFRCSRPHFVDLIEFLLKLGFVKRERFYAGAEAGWGAQILEQPVTGIVVFADVDLSPEETEIDFSTLRLPASSRLGTVGLWVGLHGESFLEAGMHHLEARFDFELLRAQLEEQGIHTMAPFSDFEFLRQAFTQAERWPVRTQRLQALFSAGLISPEQFERFHYEGAVGSHLENLQRHGGYKGFNQKSVSAIIAATDPRHTPARGLQSAATPEAQYEV